MKIIFQLLATACVIGAVPSALAAPQLHAAEAVEKPALVPSDVARVVGLSGLQFSPDGRTIAMVESRANLVENEYRTEIVLVDVATGARRQFTTDRHKAAQPRWSPDGKALGFLAPDADKRLQVFVAPLTGGEAVQTSHAKSPVAQFAWSPDSSSIAFAATDPAPEAKGADKFHTGFYLGHDDFTVREKPRSTHMWLVAADGSSERRLTSGEWSLPTVLPPGPPASPLKWTPDGKSIIFVKQASPSSGDRSKAQLHKIDIASGAMTALAPETKFVGYPVPSPDGRNIVFWAPHDSTAPGGNQDVWLAQGADTPSRNLSAAVDRNIYGTWWQPDGKSLIVSGSDGLGVGLWSLSLDGKPQKLDTGSVMPANGFWVDGSISSKGAIAFIGQNENSPGELYVMDSRRAAPRKLTSVNNWVADARLGRMEAVRWKGPQGTMIDGVLTLPPATAPGRRYPVALVIHGGPNASSRLRFGVPSQALAARGFIVFEPNYRGSDNLGNAFKAAIVGDTGEGPGEDILAGLKLVMARPDVEPGKPLISGWSYGGFMTTWLLGRHPDMWKAAVSGAPVTNWQHQYDLSDANVSWELGGATPYNSRGAEKLWQQSPASMQTKIKAPTLVMSNTDDFRVPFTQAFSLFRSLEENGVETKFFVFPLRGHNPEDPIRQGDRWQVWIDWLDAHKG